MYACIYFYDFGIFPLNYIINVYLTGSMAGMLYAYL